MPDSARRWTADMVRELPWDDGNRYEVVHGVLLVTPAPMGRHQAVVAEILHRLRLYLDPLGRRYMVLTSPADISWDDDTLVQPDVFVFPRSEWTGRWPDIKTLLLAVEVLSPSSRRADRVIKRRLYQEYNVATYWMVDPDARSVDVGHPGDEKARVVTDRLVWQVVPHAPPLEIPVPELFADVPPG